MGEENVNILSNVQNEILLIGSIYKNPDLYIEHGRFIKSKYDFDDVVTKFYYDNFEIMYTTFSQKVDEITINTFMSQDADRLKLYRKYGGFKLINNWMKISNVSDFKNYMDIVKKYALLREYDKKGFNISKIINHPKFHTLKAQDIYKIIRSGADKISTVILANEESVVVNKDARKTIRSYLIKPDMGLPMPFETLTEMFKGMRLGKFLCNCMLSNEGKTRLLILLASYIAFVHNEKFLAMCNETSEEDFKACLVVTAINNKWFKDIHGIDIEKNEKEYTLGIYRDSEGNIIERYSNAWGEYTESEEDYINRVYENSEEFRKIDKIAEWLENQIDNKIYFKYMDDYSDDMIEFEIRKHNTVYGVKYFGYDTLKCWGEENWGMLKGTAELLQKLCLQLKMFGWGSLQMTDDSVITDIFSLSSQNIASAKHVKHVLDYLMMTKRLNKEDYHKYQFIPNQNYIWGDRNCPMELDLNKIYYATKIDKNRGGSKDKVVLFEVDLNFNTWYEAGCLIKKIK